MNKNKIILGSAAVLSLAATSCRDDYDFEADRLQSLDYQYAQSFKERFGTPDPEQNYNMATRVTATVSLNDASNCTIKVYTDCPVYATSKLLAEITSADNSFAFDAEKGAQSVFVTIYNGKEEVAAGYCDIQDDTIVITESLSSTRTVSADVVTRAASSVTKGKVIENFITAEGNEFKYSFGNQLYTYDELVQMVIDRGNYYYTAPFTNCVKYDDVWHAPCGWDFTNAILDESQCPLVSVPIQIDLTFLDGVEKSQANPWALSMGRQLFGPNTFFQERIKYYYSPKTSLYGNTEQEIKDQIAKIEEGFSITSTGGEIVLPFIYGATEISDQFGYVYYKDGQDPLTQPHYILMKDGRPQSNIYWNGWQGNGTPVGNMQLASWAESGTGFDAEAQPIYGYDKDAQVYGSVYKLSFFGENHDQPATYDFPAGYHIVFFVRPVNIDPNNSDPTAWQDRSIGDFNYSLPELNKRIRHYNWNGTTNGLSEGAEDQNAGARKAASWTTQGMTFLGFEDGGRDEDLNDIVFWVNGSFTPDKTPTIVPTTPESQPNAWMVACEDMGAIGDFDFNDIVFKVSHVAGQNTLTMTPMAAGGTLASVVYFGDQKIGEIHDLLGKGSDAASGSFPMVNTQKGNIQAGTPQNIDLGSLASSFTMSEEAGGFKIKVIKRGVKVSEATDNDNDIAAEVSAPQRGVDGFAAPQMMVLPSNWIWPTERTKIESAYPRFSEWVQNASNADWASHAVNDYLVQPYK